MTYGQAEPKEGDELGEQQQSASNEEILELKKRAHLLSEENEVLL